jgi:hypothetical protein
MHYLKVCVSTCGWSVLDLRAEPPHTCCDAPPGQQEHEQLVQHALRQRVNKQCTRVTLWMIYVVSYCHESRERGAMGPAGWMQHQWQQRPRVGCHPALILTGEHVQALALTLMVVSRGPRVSNRGTTTSSSRPHTTGAMDAHTWPHDTLNDGAEV